MGFMEPIGFTVFQSTHPRGVRLPDAAGDTVTSDISIHAPARGATPFPIAGVAELTNFNPRTREGCDPIMWRTSSGSSSFQSTHPRGVRRQGVDMARECCVISIHAPARGATSSFLLSFRGRQNFNPRTREGCDVALISFEIVLFLNFNPRTREGCDLQDP